MSIDELLGHSVAELKAMTDEQLMERYKSIFDLEPQAAVMVIPAKEQTPEEADIEFRKKVAKKATVTKARNEVKARSNQLLDIAGLKAMLQQKIMDEENQKKLLDI